MLRIKRGNIGLLMVGAVLLLVVRTVWAEVKHQPAKLDQAGLASLNQRDVRDADDLKRKMTEIKKKKKNFEGGWEYKKRNKDTEKIKITGKMTNKNTRGKKRYKIINKNNAAGLKRKINAFTKKTKNTKGKKTYNKRKKDTKKTGKKNNENTRGKKRYKIRNKNNPAGLNTKGKKTYKKRNKDTKKMREKSKKTLKNTNGRKRYEKRKIDKKKSMKKEKKKMSLNKRNKKNYEVEKEMKKNRKEILSNKDLKTRNMKDVN